MTQEAVMQQTTPTQPAIRIDANADVDLQSRVTNYLVGRQHAALRSLDVTALNGTVTLRGVVRTFHEKQLALHCCQRVAGVLKLVDQVDVTPSTDR